VSGFFDVMALSTLTGSAWQALRETIPGFAPVEERDVGLAAVRDLEPYRRERLGRSAVKTVPGALSARELEVALDDLRGQLDHVYLHVDLDALDVREGRANEYAAEGGPSLAALLTAIDAVFERFAVVAAAVTAYDPTFDCDGRVNKAARGLVAHITHGARNALPR
jgi:arginase